MALRRDICRDAPNICDWYTENKMKIAGVKSQISLYEWQTGVYQGFYVS